MVQTPVAVQAYRFCPGCASVLKNVSPTEHTDGNAVPAFNGFVELAAEKSTFLACPRRSIRVCANAMLIVAAHNTQFSRWNLMNTPTPSFNSWTWRNSAGTPQCI